MPKNVGEVDRGIRIVIGIALLTMGLLHVVTGGLAIAAYIFGAVALITGVVRFCPAWSIFGINTGQQHISERFQDRPGTRPRFDALRVEGGFFPEAKNDQRKGSPQSTS